MESLTVDIVTPERVAFQGTVSEIRVPGAGGEFGVLPEHTHFLSLLRAGIATLTTTEGDTRRFLIGRGFAEAGPERVVLLTDLCEDPTKIDKAAAEAALEEALLRRNRTEPTSEAWQIADRDVELATARLEA